MAASHRSQSALGAPPAPAPARRQPVTADADSISPSHPDDALWAAMSRDTQRRSPAAASRWEWWLASLSVLVAGICGLVFALQSSLPGSSHRVAPPRLARSALGGAVLASQTPAGGVADCCALEREACAGKQVRRPAFPSHFWLTFSDPRLVRSRLQPWWSGDVIYQIYPRSFADSDGDGVGDLRGILQHVDYLQALNISAVWLSPVYPSPLADFGYDVSDYKDVDPVFGTLGDLDALIAALHSRSVRLILDLVPNHTSDQHPWFISAASNRSSPYRDWYVWVDDDSPRNASSTDASSPGPPPNNWLSEFGGSAWTWEPRTRAWYLHQYLPQQPDLNWRNPKVVAAFHDIMRFWLARGVDGFRVDSLPTLVEDAQLRDEPLNPGWQAGDDPFQQQVHVNRTEDVAPLHQVVHQLRAFADEWQAVLVCETPIPPPELREFYGTPESDECQLPFNFGLVHWNADWNATRLRHEILAYLEYIPTAAVPTFVLSNHDNHRVASRLGGQRQARAALVLLLMLPGTPTVYNGEELGLLDAVLRVDQVRDPSALRRPRDLWPLVGRDPERAPMPWSADQPFGGFMPSNATAQEPWLPLPPGWNASDNVAAQAGDAASTLTLFRQLTALRRGQPALRGAPFVPLDVKSNSVLAFARPLRCNCESGTAPAPAVGVEYLPDAYERPTVPGGTGAVAFITVLNLSANSTADVNLAAALYSAGMGDDLLRLTRQGMTLAVVFDSVDVAGHFGETVDAAHVAVQPWQALVLAMPLFGRVDG